MNRMLAVATAVFCLTAIPMQGAEIVGRYVEARTCDVWTGPCFANAEMNVAGKNAVLAWQVDKGAMDGVALDGLGVVAVVKASDTLGLKQTKKSGVIFLVDKRADSRQRKALIRLAQKQAGKLVANILDVRAMPISVEICDCKGKTCAEVHAGQARIKTRCLHNQLDRACGNESAFFPPLSKNVRVEAGVAVEHSFSGRGLGRTWSDYGRRSAYVGRFTAR